MDTVTQNILESLRKFRKEIHSLAEQIGLLQQSIKEQTEATRENAEASEHEAQTEELSLAKLDRPKPLTANKIIGDQGRNPMQWLKLGVEMATLTAITAYTILAGFQLVQMKNAADSGRDSAKAAQGANELGKEALISVQRAYVTFQARPELTVIIDPNRPTAIVTMPIVNAGNTPALHIRDRVSCATPMGMLPSDYTFPDIKGGTCSTPWVASGAGVIAPKGELHTQLVSIPLSTLKEFVQQNALRSSGRIGVPKQPTRTIYFWGWIAYRDVFDKTPEHLTEFCRTLTTFAFNPPDIVSEWGFCPTHNCTDEYCPDYKERIRIADTAEICCKGLETPKKTRPVTKTK